MNTPTLTLQRFTVGPYPINGYLLSDPDTGIGAFIDPGGFQQEICDYIERQKIDLKFIFITHGHYDHTDGLVEFRKFYQVRCYAGKSEIGDADEVLAGGEDLVVGKIRVKALSTPGHTAGGISYLTDNYVFTGDALFCGTVGGTTSSAVAKQQLDSVREAIFSLPESLLVMPAHGPFSTVGAEKHCNPFFW